MENLSPDIKNFLLVVMGAGIPLIIKFTIWALHTIFKKEKEASDSKNELLNQKLTDIEKKRDLDYKEIKALDSKMDHLESIFLEYKTEKNMIDSRIKAYFERVDEMKDLMHKTASQLELFQNKFDERVVQLDDWKRSFDAHLKSITDGLETKARDNHYEIKGVNKKVYDLREKFIKSSIKQGQDVEFDADLWNDYAR